MKLVEDKNGNLLLSPEGWRTAQQICCFFSRLLAKQRQRKTERGQLEEPRDEFTEEDLEALESEIVSNDLRQAVPCDMTVPHHPIEVGTRNVCELSWAKKLQTLKLSELKEIYESLQLAIVVSPARKKSPIGKRMRKHAPVSKPDTLTHTFCKRSKLSADFRSCSFLLTGFIFYGKRRLEKSVVFHLRKSLYKCTA